MSYSNISLLLLHEYHLKEHTLLQLFTLRNNLNNNNNYINIKLITKPLSIIDNIIKSRPNGNELITLMDDIYNRSKNKSNYNKIIIYKNLNKCEIILNLYTDSLLNLKDRINKYYLLCIQMLDKFKEKLLLCN